MSANDNMSATDQAIIAGDAHTLANASLVKRHDNGTIDLAHARAAKKGEVIPGPEHFQAAESFRERTPHAMHPSRPEVVEGLKARARQAPITPKPTNPGFLGNLSNEQKVHGGLWMISAALCAFGTFSAARGIFQKDEEGKNRLQPTALGITILQGLLTAGSVYLGAQAMRGRA